MWRVGFRVSGSLSPAWLRLLIWEVRDRRQATDEKHLVFAKMIKTPLPSFDHLRDKLGALGRCWGKA
jgi:hypothetical protein